MPILTQIITLLGLFGTQEFVILLILAIPILIIIKITKFIKKRDVQNRTNVRINTAGEIEKLFALKEKGVITQQEFDDRKSALLK